MTFITSAYTSESYNSTYKGSGNIYNAGGYRSDESAIGFSTGSIDLTHNVYIMPFLCGFALDRGSSLSTPFSIGVSLEITSASGYNRIFRTTGTAMVYYVSSFRITYDQTAVQASQ